MGCGIHLFVEYEKGERYVSMTYDQFYLPRLGGIFAILAGVSPHPGFEPVALPKGLPADCSNEVLEAYSLRIADDPSIGLRYCSAEDAERWIASGQSYLMKEGVISDPDWHTPSWLTVGEFRKAVKDVLCIDGEWQGDYLEYRAVLALMEAIDEMGRAVRAVFWFDN